MAHTVINALASERHFIDHVAPVWLALPEEMRGEFLTTPDMVEHAIRRGIPEPHIWKGLIRVEGPTIVSSYGDVRKMPGELIYMEHGIGQTYSTNPDHGSYSGGKGRDRVGLFLCPSQRVADLWRKAYPRIPTVVVGIPRLDPWHANPGLHLERVHGTTPTIAISFHWDANAVAPEARWAFPHYMQHLSQLHKLGAEVIGHGHPRAIGQLSAWYRNVDFEVVKDFHAVLDRADLYICDNSSSMYEFASTRRPVVVMNAPWYRRNVEHGVRFWEYANVGVNVDGPEYLLDAIRLAWEDQPMQAECREVAVDALVAYRDGTSTERAAQAITEWVSR